MSDAADDFFDALARRGDEPLWGKITGRVRFDLVDGDQTDRWLVAIDGGAVHVSHAGGPAECSVRTERSFFNRMACGDANAMAAVLRGELMISGDVELALAVQRVFPGPPRGRMGAADGRRDDD